LHRKRRKPHRHVTLSITSSTSITSTLPNVSVLIPISLFVTIFSSSTTAAATATSTASAAVLPLTPAHFLWDGLARDTGTNLNIGFFEGHPSFEGATASSSVFGGDDPLSVRLR
jgi:hypothetical protein